MSSSHLLPEISDYIVDLLHNEPGTLQRCCLVCKSWIPRARKHLFHKVSFLSLENLEAWKDIFPDPVDSPAHYARFLHIMPAFCTSVVHKSSLPQFQKRLVCSFPLLEDLEAASCKFSKNDDNDAAFRPPTSPPLTGTLELRMNRLESITHQLLELPGGVRFRKLVCTWNCEDDIRWVRALVEKCVDTLECIEIVDMYLGNASINLSKAIRLKEVIFVLEETEDVWTTVALKTITSKHTQFKKVSIFIPVVDPALLGEAIGFFGKTFLDRWMDFDRVLVQLWESHAIHTQAIYLTEQQEKEARDFIGSLLPEMTRRGIVKMVLELDVVVPWRESAMVSTLS
ncbi:hypothetical protein BJ322DRAFT_1105182 [Thelephora terrestris]|uniref:F-box domain-containing protein n=1 Tax=Thelephora terrestris TaxID=56493 RepID=A0A9P6HM19_9AGAM|nr:hypothetical protein BJ322DRAFT_1105182 [Thelephora terrestris]